MAEENQRQTSHTP